MVFAEIIPSLPHAPGGSRRGRVEAQPAGAGEHRPCGCAAPRRDEHNMKVLLGRAAPSHTLPQVLSGVGFFGGAYSNGQKKRLPPRMPVSASRCRERAHRFKNPTLESPAGGGAGKPVRGVFQPQRVARIGSAFPA